MSDLSWIKTVLHFDGITKRIVEKVDYRSTLIRGCIVFASMIISSLYRGFASELCSFH